MDETSSVSRTGEDPFIRAYRTIRQEISAGPIQPGDQIVVTDTARRIRVSPTPVREALARLVGEGLVEDRRRHGYFVPLPAAIDLLELYRLCELFTVSALGEARRDHLEVAAWRGAACGPEPAREQLASILRLSRNSRMGLVGQRVIESLAPAFRLEAEFYPEGSDYDGLDALIHAADWTQAIRLVRLRFSMHRRRAEQVAHALGAAHRARNRANIV